MAVRGVVFDFFGTLTPGLAIDLVERSMGAVAMMLGVDPEGFGREMRRSWPERSLGLLGDSRSTLEEMAIRLGGSPTPEMLSEAHAARLADFRQMTALRPGVEAVLSDLRRLGLGICIVSDCAPELHEMWSTLPISTMVDAAVLSSEAGIKKPDPEIFLLAARLLGVEPVECLYVGDGGSDELTGARAVGMRPVAMVEPAGELLYVHDRGTPVGVEAITTLEEVVGLVGG